MARHALRRVAPYLIPLLPVAAALAVWFSALAFVPVPWPDDSAFYFVAHELFKWPPRWVMLPQAPFEPSYAIFNFNTMPLYPLLIGIGRWFGIDGSFALKFWPLAGWAASGALLSIWLLRRNAPLWLAALAALALASSPILRWSSVLVRPESLIGLIGMALVLRLSGPSRPSSGFSRRLEKSRLWNPISALLATAAYAHFNAIHLLFPVVLAGWRNPHGLLHTALLCGLYLSPWFAMIALHPSLFFQQMQVQWARLAVGNDWLSSAEKAMTSLFPSMGSPEPWPNYLIWNGLGIWGVFAASLIVLIFSFASGRMRAKPETLSLIPSAGWVLGSFWLWNEKPELWFLHYVHLSSVTFGVLAVYKFTSLPKPFARRMTLACGGALLLSTVNNVVVNISQARSLARSSSWTWPRYQSLVDCVEASLNEAAARKGTDRGSFRVWGPTFPDILIELSRRHPDWIFTRTNDFWDRNYLAERHAHEVDAVVVTEMINWEEREISAPMSAHPQIQSVWMNWDQYYLKKIGADLTWKPNRHLCQRGRWQAFIHLDPS